MDAAPCYPAQILGARVRLAGCGAVHSVFARTLNLAGGGAWLALQSPELPPVAHCIQVAWPLRDLREHFAQGGAWRWEGERLVIALRARGQVRVSTQGCATWSSPLLAHAAHADRGAQRGVALWRECARVAAGRSVFWGGARTPIAISMSRARRALRLLRRARDARDVEAAARALIGLGPGLTPAGDDALIGWLAGMALLPADAVRDGLVQAAHRVICACLTRTTDVSRAHLEDALAGQFSHSLSLFANALVEERQALDRVLHALQELARFGASSGLDAAAGLLAALSTPPQTARCVAGAHAPQVSRRTLAKENTEPTERFQSIASSTRLTQALGRESHSMDSFSVFSVAGSCFPA